MTFDDDFIRLMLSIGHRNIPLTAVGLEWPPPERIYLDRAGIREAQEGDDPTAVMVQVSMSEITDDDRAGMTHVCRGAEYRYELLVDNNVTALTPDATSEQTTSLSDDTLRPDEATSPTGLESRQ